MDWINGKAVSLSTPFDRLTSHLCTSFNMPFGLVSVLDGEHAVFRSEIGLGERSLPRDVSVSNILVTMGKGATLIIEDAAQHPTLKHHPMVAGPPYIRFFAGATVSLADGTPVGALGVMDTTPCLTFSPAQLDSMIVLAGIAGDMVDQSLAARTQAAQVALLGLAEEMSGVGQWRFNVATGHVYWSEEVYRIHGHAPGAIDPSYADVISAYHVDDQPILRALVQRAMDTGEGYDCRLRILRADGEQRLVTARARTEQDEAGKVVALFGVFQDITEADAAERNLAASEARYRLLAANASDIISVSRPDGRFSYVSPSVEAVMGYRPDEVVGRNFADFMHPDDVEATRARFMAYVEAGTDTPSPHVRYRARRKDGEIIWVEAHPKAIRDADGRLIEFQDLIRDISHTKRLEDDLLEARDRAETAARAKAEFLANMSHELRTPLTSVIGFAGLLRARDDLPADAVLYANRIAVSSDALLSVINDVLDYSKLEADAVDLDPHPFNVRALADGAGGIVEKLCVEKGVSLVVRVADDLPDMLMGDEGRLRQVLLNFLSNAAKFTAQGEVRLTLSGVAGADGWRLRAEVSDSGIGIPEDRIAGLFERFSQADSSTTRLYGGTGLGLSISQRLIEMMGGQIGAWSRPGAGSTFWFEIGLDEASAPADRIEAQDRPAAGEGGRVLVADDAPANRELVTILLSTLGYEVETVSNGAEAVEAVRNRAYDLVLMDVHMPVMDGLSATREIRGSSGAVADIPILALTANIQADQIQACLEAGMNGHIAKPIHLDELAGSTSGWIRRDAGAPSSRSGPVSRSAR